MGVSNKILFLDEMMLFNERLASSADKALLQLDLSHQFLYSASFSSLLSQKLLPLTIQLFLLFQLQFAISI